MKFKGITLRFPPLLLGATVLFAMVCGISFADSKNPIYIFIGVPMCLLLILFPLFMMYSNEKQARKNSEAMRAAAKHVHARQVTSSMRGVPVLFEGEIVKVTGLMMNKPTYIIKDSTGQMVVRRFALPERLVGVGAYVEVLGVVHGKVGNERSVFINSLTILPVARKAEVNDEGAEKVHIKKYA